LHDRVERQGRRLPRLDRGRGRFSVVQHLHRRPRLRRDVPPGAAGRVSAEPPLPEVKNLATSAAGRLSRSTPPWAEGATVLRNRLFGIVLVLVGACSGGHKGLTYRAASQPIGA